MRLDKPRIQPLPDEALPPELWERMKTRPSADGMLNIFRTLANDPVGMYAFLDWGGYILSKRNGLPARQREIVILRTGWLCKSGYEWNQHVRVGTNAGLTAPEIDAIKVGASDPSWSAADAALIVATDELHSNYFISDAAWAGLDAHFNDKQKADLIFTAGQYTMVSMFLNSVGVQLEAGKTVDPDLRT